MRWVAVTLGGACLALAGCTPAPAESPSTLSPGLEAQFDAELALPLSDYARGILEDKEITGAEFQDAHHRYVECVNESFPGRVEPAYASVPRPGGTVEHTFAGTQEDLALFDRIEPVCLQEYLGGGAIESLYWQIIKNPEALPLDQVTLNCLVKKGLVDPDTYGLEQLEGDISHDINYEESDDDTPLNLEQGEAFNCWAYKG